MQIEIKADKIIENYKFDDEKLNKVYNGDYKKLALDLAKENQRLALENLLLKKEKNNEYNK